MTMCVRRTRNSENKFNRDRKFSKLFIAENDKI